MISAFLNPLLHCSTLAVELNHIAGFPVKVRNYKSYSREKFTCVPFNLDDYTPSLVQAGGLVLKTFIQNDRLSEWTAYKSCRQMFNLVVQYSILF